MSLLQLHTLFSDTVFLVLTLSSWKLVSIKGYVMRLGAILEWALNVINNIVKSILKIGRSQKKPMRKCTSEQIQVESLVVFSVS